MLLQKRCEHEWKEENAALFLFRCKLCRALGYRTTKVEGFSGFRKLKTGDIIPYVCSAPDCRRVATFLWNSATSIHYCDIHEKPKELSEESREYIDAVAKEDLRVKKVNEDAFAELRRIREEL